MIHEDTRLGIKPPTDDDGNERRYTLTIRDAEGNPTKVPLKTGDLKELFKDWQLNIPAFVIHEPMGMIEMDSTVSPREVALISAALNAYYNAGRLNLNWKEDWKTGDPDPITTLEDGSTHESWAGTENE